MKNQTAFETDLKIIPEIRDGYDRDLHERFISWKNRNGYSFNQLARKLPRSKAAISKYASLEYDGNISAFEQDIRSLLRRGEENEFTTETDIFHNISTSRRIWEVLQFCDKQKKMGAVIAPAGLSKTITANEYTRKNPGTILVTADITKRSLGSVLAMIMYKSSYRSYHENNSHLLDMIVDKLEWSKNLLILDESHLLSWESFEAIRAIYDRAKTGIVYLGMPRLYGMMKGNRAYLWDQILSRIAIQVGITAIDKADIKLIADSIYPGLPNNCLGFLYEKASGAGKLRIMVELLDRAVHIHKIEGVPVNLKLLKEVNQLFSI